MEKRCPRSIPITAKAPEKNWGYFGYRDTFLENEKWVIYEGIQWPYVIMPEEISLSKWKQKPKNKNFCAIRMAVKDRHTPPLSKEEINIFTHAKKESNR